jgi:hypothetical protein
MLSALKAYRLFVEKAEEESGMKSVKRNFMAVLIPVILLLAALACQRSQTTPVTTV